ncbi:MAG: glycosyltransferase family 9 protein [Bacteroidota bacterium]
MKILILQPAFIGDVVLATSLIESLKNEHIDCHIDFLVRKGNDALLLHHPKIKTLLVFDRKQGKLKELRRLIKLIRKEKYDYVINPHRFGSSGILTALSKAKFKIGFRKNPFSLFYSRQFEHSLESGLHEIERNHQLISSIVENTKPSNPRLYPVSNDYEGIPEGTFVCMAPASVWFTKQYPAENWVQLVNRQDVETEIHLIGGPGDRTLCENIATRCKHPLVKNRAGELSFLQSAALISKAQMTYANDSAPMHFASAMNAPITAIFCSTIPSFGFGPLSDQSKIAQQSKHLSCRPCGIHGKKSCPEGHFECAKFQIEDGESLY